MENQIKRENFEVIKAKIGKHGGLDVHYTLREVIGNDIYTNKYHVENTKELHPDLFRGITQLNAVLANSLGFADFFEYADSVGEEATEAAKECYNNILMNISVTGITYSGVGINAGVVITGTKICGENFGTTALVSPRIHYNENDDEYSKRLREHLSRINDEIFEFLFNDKKAQLEIFGNGENQD